jgi:DNA-binding transcriptional LysR family regulator
VPRGELVIAANEATCLYVLPDVFSQFKKLFPNVQLHVDRSYGSRVVEAVLDNLADFGICQFPIQEKKLQVVLIHTDEIKLICAPSHPLATATLITPEALLGHPLLLPKAGTTRSRLNVWMENVEDSTQISMELDSTEMMKRFVMAGLGVAFLSTSSCAEEVAEGKLVAIGLSPEPMLRRLGLIYRKDKALSKASLGLIQVILNQAAISVGSASNA